MPDTFMTIISQAEGNDRDGFRITHYGDGRQFASKAEAVSRGFELAASDDFNVGVVSKGRLGGRTVLLSHFPYEGDHTAEERHSQFRLRDEGEWLIHGHTHQDNRLGPYPRYLAIMDPVGGDGITSPRGREIHAGLDAWELRPAGEAAILEVIREYEVSMNGAADAARGRLAEIRVLSLTPDSH